MDDADDQHVARRGSQGDDWQWESPTPPDPNRERKLRMPDWVRRAGGWIASSFAAVREFFNTPYRAPEPPPADTSTPQIEPEPPSVAPQAVADTESAAESSQEHPRKLGAIVRWSAIVPRFPRRRTGEAIAWSKVAPRPSRIPDDSGSLLVLLASLGLAAAIVIGVILAVEAIGDGDNGSVVAPGTETPRTTLIPPVSETPRPTVSPSASPSKSPSATPSASPSPTAGSPTPTAIRTATPTPVTPAPPNPQGAVSAGFWANGSSAWWFGTIARSVAVYSEGQEVPLLARWEGVAGQTYQVHISYDCTVSGASGAIDYLSGLQSWGSNVVYARYGPAKEQPDAAVLAPDTSGFIPDDGNSGVIALYGGKFPVLPDSPSPSGACTGRRTASFSVEASGGTVAILASGHLGLSSIYGSGKGAAGATSAMSVTVAVDGVGSATASIDPSAIS